MQVEEFLVETGDVRPKKAKALSLARWKSMKFSADGQSILIATDASLVLTLHAFEGDVKQVWYIVLIVCCNVVWGVIGGHVREGVRCGPKSRLNHNIVC